LRAPLSRVSSSRKFATEPRSIHLGLFDDPEAAFRAYLIGKAQYHRFQREPREMNTVERAIAAALWFCSPEWRAIVEDVT